MAEQARLQDSKERFQSAYDNVVNQKEETEKEYNDAKERGMADRQTFGQWYSRNAPDYAVVEHEYRQARVVYEAALQAADQQGFKDWQEKVKNAQWDNRQPDGSLDYDVLVGPDA
ncbi:hypothetical protein NXS19_014314 [Fusarium pseudograminearum]|nr:hypothetical protein NXS19_014314 [Fusarium pseudograminearum]